MLLLSAFSSKKLEKPHFPRHPGFICIVLTMPLNGHGCPQFAPKNFGAEGVWTSALPLKKNPCDLFELPVDGRAAGNVGYSFADHPARRMPSLSRQTQVKLAFADPRFSYTHVFERHALELSQHMTIKDVARLGRGNSRKSSRF